MKRVLCVAAFLVLAAQPSLWGYDTSPGPIKVVPEAVWAAATGGGTWVTELQITSYGSYTAAIDVSFAAAGGIRGPIRVHPGLSQFSSVRFSNILSQLQTLDPSFDYYGRVGALYIITGDENCLIQVQAKTVNGNYGKTFPGMNIIAGNTAAEGRPMVIQDIAKSATYRTSVGAFNTSGTITYTVRFFIYDAAHGLVGSYFDKTLAPLAFLAFNPFTQAGITSGDYENCWLLIDVYAGGEAGEGLMCFGSIANNYTNDTYALIPLMFNAE